MNKKLVALAVAAAFAAPVAMAQVTLYGTVHADIRFTDDGDDSESWSVNSNVSKLGFKGSTDLGNGMKALFKYETTYNGLDGQSTLGGPRNSYIGLSGSKGTLVVGRHDTPAKMAFYAAGNDHLGDSIVDFNRVDPNTGAGFTESRVPNAIAYVSPAMSGFTVAIAGVPGEQSGDENGGANDENGLIDSYSLGIMYKGNGIKAGFGYENLAHMDNAPGESNENSKMTQIGASYTFDNITVGGQFENTRNYGNNAAQTKKVMGLAMKASFGKNAIIANYSKQDLEDSTTATETESNHIGVALQHKINKRANVYLAFNKQETGNDDRNNVALGMKYSF